MNKLFGSMTFNEAVMKERLPKEAYITLKKCIAEDKSLPLDIANTIANAMKDWAVEKGVTHYTHWFQPMTGHSAEKHDSFITPTSNGTVLMEFSGKELIKGESDASSFPSGGLRATFEARGYTAWDPTSYAFIKDGILCIPTAFCSFTGEALDKKTPLLKSMEAINKQALRILKLFGKNDVNKVYTTVGPEQEYFLLDSKAFNMRKDLMYTGRTLFGAKPPKGQELEDHYYGAIKPRVVAYMKELDEELWKVGILAKTKHNEVAPSQHELAPIFTTANIATDHNQITMEIMRKVASRHNLVCVLHEKPFEYVNGSGKHNNWSLMTDTGMNLFEPGNNPDDDAQFLLFLSAVIKAVDEHQDLLRISSASAGNDSRLGANEAPPAIISVFLGEELTGILEAIEENRSYSRRAKCDVKIGVHVLPKLPQDSTDRNRTSPFAFTGNKFEFRMVGSAFSIAGPNIMLNTMVAESLSEFADILEKADNFTEALKNIIVDTVKKHKKIIFNGNNYCDEWVTEAKERGLLNLKTTVDAMKLFSSKKNIELFKKHNVFTEAEIKSRQEILIGNYAKIRNIEAQTMVDMMRKEILPCVLRYVKELTRTYKDLAEVNLDNTSIYEQLLKLSELYSIGAIKLGTLEKIILDTQKITDETERATAFKDNVLPAMSDLRVTADELESITPERYWPFPTYDNLLFGVN